MVMLCRWASTSSCSSTLASQRRRSLSQTSENEMYRLVDLHTVRDTQTDAVYGESRINCGQRPTVELVVSSELLGAVPGLCQAQDPQAVLRCWILVARDGMPIDKDDRRVFTAEPQFVDQLLRSSGGAFRRRLRGSRDMPRRVSRVSSSGHPVRDAVELEPVQQLLKTGVGSQRLEVRIVQKPFFLNPPVADRSLQGIERHFKLVRQ